MRAVRVHAFGKDPQVDGIDAPLSGRGEPLVESSARAVPRSCCRARDVDDIASAPPSSAGH